MKVAIVFNRESKSVINLFGASNKEKIGLKTIDRIKDALKAGGHQVTAIEGDKDLIDNLEHFMPRVVKGERPGIVFNVSYGIQGQSRYTHIPSILEMVGIPYVASGPLAHSLALDKVVTKMILRQHNLPTPDFAVLNTPDADLPDLAFPMIVKPKNEAVSFGLKVVENETELREAASIIFKEYQQPVLAEQFIEGREVNVGLLGNHPPEALPPVELIFGDGGPAIYTYEDKTAQSGRRISHQCPAQLDPETLDYAQQISRQAFSALGCYDCARVDMRMDAQGKLFILEINSLPSLGEHGSYLVGAAQVGLDFGAVINRLVDVASARYFGTPEPPQLDGDPEDRSVQVSSFVTQRRDAVEKRLQEWAGVTSHTNDPVGIREAVKRVGRTMREIALRPVQQLTDEKVVWCWETAAGMADGLLLLVHLDVPVDAEIAPQVFRREPEWLYGDGIGSSRAPLVMLEFSLRALRALRVLRKIPLGVMFYSDEGRDARYSSANIAAACAGVKNVLVLRPGNIGDKAVVQRRGQRKYRFRAESDPIRPAKLRKRPETLRWFLNRLEDFSKQTSQKDRISVSCIGIKTEALPLLLPHRATATILVTYPDKRTAEELERSMRSVVDRKGPRWELELISDRPPMADRKINQRLASKLHRVAKAWDITLGTESSVWPSVAGLVPAKTACVCGLGPVARGLGTPHESVERISLVQRTLLLAEFLAQSLEEKK